MKFTKQGMADLVLPAGRREHFFWDDDLPGFGVRLREGNKRRRATWTVQYRVGAKQRRESLGDVRKVTLDAARAIARQRFAKVELGSDPAAERAEARRVEAERLSLATVVERYLDAKQERLRPSTMKQAKLHLANYWKPLHGRSLAGITRADVAAQLLTMTKVHGRTAAARARGNLSALFAWAIGEGLCDGNPVVSTNDPSEGIQPRDRVLTDDEIRIVWNACRDDSTGRIVRLLLLTGARREEIGGLRWSEVDLDTGVMTIPGERTKNKRELLLPLPPLALDVLKSIPERQGRTFVFGRKDGPFAGWAAAKLKVDATIAINTGKTFPPWTFHDLRRSYRTGLGKLGVPPHVAELAINHVKGGIQAVYDKHRYTGEIGLALARWAEHVTAIVEGRADKVVPLRSSA